jgi:hypothetical protein
MLPADTTDVLMGTYPPSTHEYSSTFTLFEGTTGEDEDEDVTVCLYY